MEAMTPISFKSLSFRKLVSLLDGLYIRFSPVFLILSIPIMTIEKKYFNVEKASILVFALILGVTIYISLTWTSLSNRVNLPLHYRNLTSDKKTSALLARGFWLWILYKALSEFEKVTDFSSILGMLSNKAAIIFLNIGLIIIITSMIMIFIKPVNRKGYKRKGSRR